MSGTNEGGANERRERTVRTSAGERGTIDAERERDDKRQAGAVWHSKRRTGAARQAQSGTASTERERHSMRLAGAVLAPARARPGRWVFCPPQKVQPGRKPTQRFEPGRKTHQAFRAGHSE